MTGTLDVWTEERHDVESDRRGARRDGIGRGANPSGHENSSEEC